MGAYILVAGMIVVVSAVILVVLTTARANRQEKEYLEALDRSKKKGKK